MIFATVGTQLPFPRLIDALNALAPELGEPIVAQVGPDSAPGQWPALDCRGQLKPQEFEGLFQDARIVIAHAGIGTILSARRWGKPLVILPRRHALDEHRNDHQLATARQVSELPGVHVAWDVEEIAPLLQRQDLQPAGATSSPNRDALIAHLRAFIAQA